MRFLAVLGVLAALYVLATMLYAIAAYQQPLPYLDQWAAVAEARGLDAGEFTLNGLWRQHNEHRIIVPRLLFFVDHFAFAGRGVFLLCLSSLFQLAQVALVLRLFQHSAPRSRAGTVAVGAMLTVFMLSSTQIPNLIEPFQVMFVLVFTAATTAFCALARARRGPRAGIWLATTIAAALVCNYTLANGILVWPLLLTMGWRLRLGRRPMLLFFVVGALSSVGYMWGYWKPPGHSDPWTSLLEPHLVLRYIACYLGSPLRMPDGEHDFWVAGVAGALGYVIFAAMAWRTMRRNDHFGNESQVALVHIGLFVAGSAVLTALGRVDMGLVGAMTARYSTPALIFWSMVFVLGVSSPSRTVAVLSGFLTALLGASLVGQQGGHIDRDGEVRQQLRQVSLELLVGIRDVEANVGMPRDFASIRDLALNTLIPFLQEQRASIFADGREAPLGRALAEQFLCDRSAACSGGIDVLEPVPGTGWAFRARGWAYHGVAKEVPQTVYFVDDSGIVVGLADMDERRPDVAKVFPESGGERVGFHGYGVVSSPHETITAYAGMHDGRVCQIGVHGQHRFGGPELGASAPGRPIPGLEEVPVGDWLALLPAEWPMLPAPYGGARCSTERGKGTLQIGPIPIPAAAGVLGVPVVVGPRPFGLFVWVMDMDSHEVVRQLLPPPSHRQWSVWRVELPPGLAGHKLAVVAGDDGSRPGQWIAIAHPFWTE